MISLAGGRQSASLTERELVERSQRGDAEAFERLASLHTDHLYAVLLRLMGDRAEAEDVLQESLLRAWRGIGQFQKRSMFFTWLYRIAVNEANRALARHASRGAGRDIDLESVQLRAPANQEPAHQAEHHELHAMLGRAIAELDPAHRTALVLRDIEGLSTREAADIVGVGEAAFKSRLHQARLRLRAAMGDAVLAAGGAREPLA
jgi:RNA polymerase sigma-70 factor (ECF subfamily)